MMASSLGRICLVVMACLAPTHGAEGQAAVRAGAPAAALATTLAEARALITRDHPAAAIDKLLPLAGGVR